MRLFLRTAALAAIVAAPPLHAQPAALPDPTTFAAAADIQALIARARREIKPGAPLLVQPLLRFRPYNATLEYRRGAWPAALHPDIEMFFVVQGAGTFVSGGELVGAKPGANGNMSGSDIAGGTTRQVRQGDVFVAPARTPHMFPQPDGELVLAVIHIPAAAPN